MKIVLVSFFVVLSLLGELNAQDSNSFRASLSGDFVSSYVWRGFKQAGASVQPSLSVGYSEFTLSAWGSTDITGDDKKEVDFSLSYNRSNLTIGLTDYWWDGEFAERYFSSPQEGNSGHLLEANFSYLFSNSFPLTISWNTFLLGHGNKTKSGNNSYSTYVELDYSFILEKMDFVAFVGAIPWNSAVYGEDMRGFKVSDVGLKASKEIAFNKSFSLPIYVSLLSNPAREDIHFVLGVTIR